MLKFDGSSDDKNYSKQMDLNKTFSIDDSLNRTAMNNLKPLNDLMKPTKRVERVKKGNVDGTPLTSKSSGYVAQTVALTHPFAKPKTLRAITNMQNGSQDGTLKIPLPVSKVHGGHCKKFSFDDVCITDESDSESLENNRTKKAYPGWSAGTYRNVYLESQRYMGDEGEINESD